MIASYIELILLVNVNVECKLQLVGIEIPQRSELHTEVGGKGVL